MINTYGASKRTGYSVTWIQKLVQRGKLTAYIYMDGECVKHDPSIPQKGHELYFYEEDLAVYKPRKVGRPAGASDKVQGNRKGRPGPRKAS